MQKKKVYFRTVWNSNQISINHWERCLRKSYYASMYNRSTLFYKFKISIGQKKNWVLRSQIHQHYSNSFSSDFLAQKILKPSVNFIDQSRNRIRVRLTWDAKVEHLFANSLRAAFRCTKVSQAAFLYLHFRFVFFWWKNIGVKLTQ